MIRQTIAINKNSFNKLPQEPGIYIFKNNGKPVYIGKAVNLKNRLKSYLTVDLLPKTKKMIGEAQEVGFIKVTSELEALLLEASLVKKYQPKYNILLKDDKNPLYIRVTKEEYSRVLTARKLSEKEANLAFFGPFPNARIVKSVLKMIRKSFPYSDHKIGKKACFLHSLNLCNPCPSEIENEKDPQIKSALRKTYLKNIKLIILLLNRKNKVLEKSLLREIAFYSKDFNYEKAQEYKIKLDNLKYVLSTKNDIGQFIQNPNLSEDLSQKGLGELKKVLNLFFPIKTLSRIECFDVAHLSGASPTASMVTFIAGFPEKSLYRKFKIRQNESNSDVASLMEIAQRRIKNFNTWGKPDLIVVDGGKPQASVFYRHFAKEKINVIGLAKREETIVIPYEEGETVHFKEIRLKDSQALYLLKRLRDEAHRFAQKYHHQLFVNTLLKN
jgi:excinuclease ABC subunit C